ncbi:hypothetical protein [Streptomyces sp. NPDC006739]|uniref:hypothetical protein n=1 Tax=Streptomyces sp. NPDC006739 TaxID=3364763 RepID=UPI0036B8A219
MAAERHGRGPWFMAAVVAVACLLTACGSGGTSGGTSGGGSGSPSGSTPPRPSADPHPTTPSAGGTGTAPPGTRSPGCEAGSAAITHRAGDASVRSLCVRSGTTVTVVLEPRTHGPWPPPRSSNPMLALVTSSTTDGQGGARVTVRAARIGAASVTWGPEKAPLFTLRLSVAAYPVQ